MYLKNLALALLWNRSSSKCTINDRCSWMSSHAARSKSPQLGWTGGKSAHTKQDSQGCPRNCSLIHYEEVAEKTQVPLEGILNVRHGY